MYNSKYSFYNCYRDSKKIDYLSFKSKYLLLHKFLGHLNKFEKLTILK